MATTTARPAVRGRHRSGRVLGPGQGLVLVVLISTAFWLAVGAGIWWAVR